MFVGDVKSVGRESPKQPVPTTSTDAAARVPSDKVTVANPSEPRGVSERPSGELRRVDPLGSDQARVRAKGKSDAEILRVVRELEDRDRQVRAHEAAHAAAGGALAGAPSFSFQTGPDGRSYAIGGEVSIALEAGHTPEETIARARQIRAAALAPADPSGQDLSVAASATVMESRAMLEAAERRREAGDAAKVVKAERAREPGATDPVKPAGDRGEAARVLRFQPGGTAHLHSSDGCGSCAKNVAYYRTLAMSA